MRFLKIVVLFVFISINLDISSQWITTDSYTGVGTQNNLNIELKINEQYTGSAISCIGASDGEMAIIISGGTPPYSVNWASLGIVNSVTSTDTIRGIPNGSYNVIVTDNGIPASHTIFLGHTVAVSDPSDMTLLNNPIYNAFNINYEMTAPICSDSLNGSIRANFIGGSGNKSYLWGNGDSVVFNPITASFNSFADSLGNGIHSLRITDDNGCIKDTTFEINLPLPIYPNVVITHPGCAGDNNGILTSSPSGGTGTFSNYTWDDPALQTTAAANSLAPGTYNIIVKDSDGCQGDTSVTVVASPAIVISLTEDPVKCFNGNDGSATSVVSGGTPSLVSGYQYLWDDGAAQTSAIASALTANVYTLTITDSINCSNSESVTVN